jgi:hypothetical protein
MLKAADELARELDASDVHRGNTNASLLDRLGVEVEVTESDLPLKEPAGSPSTSAIAL